MNDIPLKFGVPDTLPALSRREIRGCFIFAAMGLFVLLVGLFPALRPPPRMALPLALCWLAFPAWGLFRFFTHQRRTIVKTPLERAKGTSTQVSVYVVVMVAAGVGFFVWARQLGVPSPVIFGSLLIIEGLGGVIVSLTEWWRLSHIGVPLSRFTSRVGGGSAFYVRQHDTLYEFITRHPEGETKSEGIVYFGIPADADDERERRLCFSRRSFAPGRYFHDASLGVWPVFIARWSGESFRLCVHFHSGSEIDSRS